MAAPLVLSPFVYWAQKESVITLRVDLRNVKAPDIQVTDQRLEFRANGVGAKGENKYQFQLDFFKPINPDGNQFRVTDRSVEFYIEKKENAWWPRLISSEKKPGWLKVDFDNLKTESDDEYDDDIDMDFKENQSYRDVMEDLNKRRRKKEKQVEDFRKIYLFLYNLFQFVGFLYIFIVMTIRYAKEGPFSMEGTYIAVGRVMKFCTLMQLLETIHPMLGYTSGSFVTPFIQTFGRIVMVIIMIDAEPRMQTKPVVFYLFLIYSAIEIVRYQYYMLRTYNVNVQFVTWLRYTIWIPLYPLGFLCEGVIILRNIPYFEETGRFTVSLPNPWNFSFHFPTAMRIYLLIGFFPVLYFLMTHMYRQRVKMVGPKSWQKKN